MGKSKGILQNAERLSLSRFFLFVGKELPNFEFSFVGLHGHFVSRHSRRFELLYGLSELIRISP